MPWLRPTVGTVAPFNWASKLALVKLETGCPESLSTVTTTCARDQSAALKPLVAQLTLSRWTFDDELLFLAQKAGLRLTEVPVAWINDFDSKVKAADYLTTIFDLFRVKLNYYRGRYKL